MPRVALTNSPATRRAPPRASPNRAGRCSRGSRQSARKAGQAGERRKRYGEGGRIAIAVQPFTDRVAGVERLVVPPVSRPGGKHAIDRVVVAEAGKFDADGNRQNDPNRHRPAKVWIADNQVSAKSWQPEAGIKKETLATLSASPVVSRLTREAGEGPGVRAALAPTFSRRARGPRERHFVPDVHHRGDGKKNSCGSQAHRPVSLSSNRHKPLLFPPSTTGCRPAVSLSYWVEAAFSPSDLLARRFGAAAEVDVPGCHLSLST